MMRSVRRLLWLRSTVGMANRFLRGRYVVTSERRSLWLESMVSVMSTRLRGIVNSSNNYFGSFSMMGRVGGRVWWPL